ncbi:type 4a pilus biogenesis protein PilO [Moorellaceae bacterium AZ2]
MKWPQYRSLSPREKRWLILFLVAGVIVFSYRVVWAHQLPYYRQVKAELAAQSAKLAAAREAAGRLWLLKEELARAETEMEELQGRAGFTLQQRETFLAAAQPQQRGVRVLSFRPLEPEQRGSFVVYPFQISVEGAYLQVEDYIHQLESLPALTQMRDLKISAKAGAAGLVEASFILDFYALDGEGAAAGRAVALLPSNRPDIFLPLAGGSMGRDSAGLENRLTGRQEELSASTPAAAAPPSPPPDSGDTAKARSPRDEEQSGALEYVFPSRGSGRARAGAPWLEGIRVLRNVGPFYYPAGRKIAIGGRQFEHGIVVDLEKSRSQAEAVLDLQAGYLKLRGFIGVEDETMNSRGNFVLRIKGDERELFVSSPVKPGRYPQYVELDVAGVNLLILQVEWVEAGPGDYDRLQAALADMILLTAERNI